MKPNKKESRIKEFRRAQKRIHELHDLITNAPYLPLKKKLFAGHWRFFKVRDDILRSSIGNAAKLVVDACNTWVLGKKKEPKTYEKYYGVEYCKYFGETTVSKQTLRPLTQEQLDRLNFPNRPSFIRRWFDVEEKTRSYGSKNVVVCRYFPRIPPHMIEFAFKAAYITEEKTKLGDYESELAKIYQFMEDNHAYEHLNNNYRDEWFMSLDKKKMLEKLKDQELRLVEEEL
jgi:hypothetical protein